MTTAQNSAIRASEIRRAPWLNLAGVDELDDEPRTELEKLAMSIRT